MVDKIVAFGDSLTDIGNANLSQACQSEGVFCGDRTSNGLLIVDYIAEKLCLSVTSSLASLSMTGSVGDNYAVSAARAAEDTNDNNFQAQVTGDFGHLTFQAPADISPKTLYFVCFGGNDILDALIAAGLSGLEAASDVIHAAIAAMKVNIEQLIDAGACSFLVIGTFNIAFVPLVTLDAKASGASIEQVVGTADSLSRSFNVLLEEMLQDLTIPDDDGCLGIKYIDTITITEAVLDSEAYEAKFGAFDLASVTDAICNFRFVDPVTGRQLMGGLPALPENEIDFECEGLPYYDEVHPTTDFYKLIAERMFDEEVEDFVKQEVRIPRVAQSKM